jgi:hypothetical protein
MQRATVLTAITSMHPNYHDHECSYVYLLQLDLFSDTSTSTLTLNVHLSVSIWILLTWLALLRHIPHLRIVAGHLGHHPITSWLRLHSSWLRLYTWSTIVS